MLRVLSRSCCMLCLNVRVQLRSEIRRHVASCLQEPAVTSLPFSHRANAIRASRVIHKPDTSKAFISAMGHTIVIGTGDKILKFMAWALSTFQMWHRMFARSVSGS